MTTTTTKTITDTLYNKLINEHLSNLPKIGDIVKGRIISANNKEILIDIDGFTTGVARGREMKNLPEEFHNLNTGDEIQSMVIELENEKGQMELSLHAALIESAWQYIKDKERTQDVISVRITGANKGGLLTSIRGIPSFLPVSQLTVEHYPRVEGGDKKKILKKLKSFIGKTVSVKIMSYEMEGERVIISEKRAWEELQRQKLQQYKIGDVVPIVVKATTTFGVFIEFGDHLEGLIHISEIPVQFKTNETSINSTSLPITLKAGDAIEARIIDIKWTKVFFSLQDVNQEPPLTPPS